MDSDHSTVFLIDDDPIVLNSLSRALRQRGLMVEAFSSANGFLNSTAHTNAGCLILDICIPGMTGLQLQKELNERAITMPVIFITGHGEVTQSVQALKAGALDFFEKPLKLDTLYQRILEAFEKDQELRLQKLEENTLLSRFQRLTKRELDVLQILTSGAANQSSRDIAATLGISHRTVELHRARIMDKTQARSVTELVEMLKRSGFTFTVLSNVEMM
ncbi:MAG: response regulator [Granulosicoccus sp.]|nr:response regulator [Granulosicoccus sp.]